MVSTTLLIKAHTKGGVFIMSKTDLSIIGKQYGYWTVLKKDDSYHSPKHTKWICQCECGTVKSLFRSSLLNGRSRSCGCHANDNRKGINKTHGLSKTRIYHEWLSMRNRCSPDNKVATQYYERGIRVCNEWENDFMSFYNWSINNGYDDSLTIDRIDNNGNYEPSNCRWVNRKEQAKNRRSTYFITYNGKTQCLKDWADEFNINRITLTYRLKRGWDISEALTTPKLINPHARQNKNKSKGLGIDNT